MKMKSKNIARLSSLFKIGKRSQTGCYIISYPTCGRTWLRVLIGKALCEQYHLPEDQFSNINAVTKAAGIIPTRRTHDGCGINSEAIPYHQLNRDKSKFKGKKVIFLTRDIRDVLVSSYFHTTKRSKSFHGSISEFIRSDIYGVRKILTFYNLWHANRTLPSAFLHLRYEDMKKNTGAVLSQILEFMGAERVETTVIDHAVAAASFENMKKMEQNREIRSFSAKQINENDNETFKVRRGVVGGYRDYLSGEDLQYIDEVVSEMGNPFA